MNSTNILFELNVCVVDVQVIWLGLSVLGILSVVMSANVATSAVSMKRWKAVLRLFSDELLWCCSVMRTKSSCSFSVVIGILLLGSTDVVWAVQFGRLTPYLDHHPRMIGRGWIPAATGPAVDLEPTHPGHHAEADLAPQENPGRGGPQRPRRASPRRALGAAVHAPS